MKKILFDMKLIDRHYCFYLDDADNQVYAYGIKLNSFEGYHVSKASEVQFLNKIIGRLENKYIRRKDVFYNNEYYARYKNTYTNMNYFAKLVNGQQVACPYEDAKPLYDFYNNPAPEYAFDVKQSKTTGYFGKQESSVPRRKTRGRRYKGRYEAAADITTNYSFEEDPTYNTPKKKGNGILRVVIVAGVVCFVVFSYFGVKLFADGKPIILKPKEKTVQTDQPNKMDEKETTNSQIPDGLDVIADTDEEITLATKYEGVEQQLVELGLEPWQIAVELDKLSMFEGDEDDIAFYYDNEANEVVFVYGEHTLGQEETAEIQGGTTSYNSIPEGVTAILNAIADNPNLTEEEKAALIELNLDDWISNIDYLSIDELVARYSMLDIQYEYQEEGMPIDLEYTPYTNAAGVYRYERIDGQVTKSEITIYSASSLEQSLQNYDKTLEHEGNHIEGNFSAFSSSLLNEGYTSFISEDESYEMEKLMVAMMTETFGAELIKQGYYGFDLAGVLTNNIAAKSKRDYMDVREEVEDLLEEIEMCLFKTGDLGETFREDALLMQEYQALYKKLSDYYSLMNDGQKMSDNAIAAVIMDYVLGTNNTKVLGENEKFLSLRYGKDGALEFNITVTIPNISYDVGYMHLDSTASNYTRGYVIPQDEKNEGTSRYAKVSDENINYFSR